MGDVRDDARRLYDAIPTRTLPWECDGGEILDAGLAHVAFIESTYRNRVEYSPIAQFIAAAPSLVAGLLDRLGAVEDENRRLREAVRWLCTDYRLPDILAAVEEDDSLNDDEQDELKATLAAFAKSGAGAAPPVPPATEGDESTEAVPCPVCEGRGYIHEGHDGAQMHYVTCDACDGTGGQ